MPPAQVSPREYLQGKREEEVRGHEVTGDENRVDIRLEGVDKNGVQVTNQVVAIVALEHPAPRRRAIPNAATPADKRNGDCPILASRSPPQVVINQQNHKSPTAGK